ncbi:MAG: HlyD family efflux transporter periplasmic adaptor subunit, partial [Pseudomonadales bacterium]|nr:HlyD family efflux transporter periplasmic adaptor subunit [Pseudomonadales bacterium]
MSKMNLFREGFAWLKRRRLLGTAVFLIFVLLSSLVVVTGPQAEPEQRQEKAWPVSTMEAIPDSVAPTLVVFGKLESRQFSSLRTSISAEVNEVFFHEGEWVEEGALLVQLDDRERSFAVTRARSEVRRQEAQLATVVNEYELAQQVTENQQALKTIAEARLQRHLDLYNTKMVSDAIVDEVRQQANERSMALARHLASLKNFPNLIAQQEAAVADARALLDKALLDLDQTRIIAPFRGRIVRAMVSPGDRASPFEPLMEIANFDQLEVRASVPALAGNTLRRQLQQHGLVTAVGVIDGDKVPLRLERVSGNVKAGRSGLDAFFLPEGDHPLDIGRVVDVRITMPVEEDVLAVPLQALYEGDRVYKVENSRLVAMKADRVGELLDDEGQYRVLVRVPSLQSGDQLV